MRNFAATATVVSLVVSFLQGCVTPTELSWNRPPPPPPDEHRPVHKATIKRNSNPKSSYHKPVTRVSSSPNSKAAEINQQILEQRGGGGGGGGSGGGGW